MQIGIGDDAAVWQPSRSMRGVMTTDAFVEGVHFTAALTPFDIGYRSMAGALSDIAAMGAGPTLVTVALGLPPERTDDVVALYRGMLDVCARGGAIVAGGDLTRSPALWLSITALGEVRPSHLKTRAGAKRGDVLAVTGALGAARAGWMCEDGATALDDASLQAARAAYRRPPARFAEGRWLGASSNVHAMMDLSDGLSSDVLRLCAASDCGAEIDAVPVAPAARAFATLSGAEPETFALAGGEDYELLAAIDARAFGHIAARFRARFGRELLAVGKTKLKEEGVTVRRAGGRVALQATGWDHFRS